MEESEFGKGLVVCLVKLAEHKERWKGQKELNEAMSDAVKVHFNGASDHLYEIQVPEEWRGTEIESKVKELQELGLKIGHGFTDEEWSEEHVYAVYNRVREVAVMIDKKLGLDADIGQW